MRPEDGESFPPIVSSADIVTLARSIFHGSPEEDDNGISLYTQQFDSFRSETRVAAQPSNRFPPSGYRQNVRHLTGATRGRS